MSPRSSSSPDKRLTSATNDAGRPESSHQCSQHETKEIQPSPAGTAMIPRCSGTSLIRDPVPSIVNPEQPHTLLEIRLITKPPITLDQLIEEVRAIYGGLTILELRCIQVDQAQLETTQQIDATQGRALIELHRTLLYQHYDFFFASQHPAANDSLRNLAAKYAMPARMWHFGIHSLLEILRTRFPASKEFMLTFLYLAYSMMVLLYETIPAFKDIWVECLGDLARYIVAVEDTESEVRETWINTAAEWYSKASEKMPTTGRLYHHLAILTWPNTIKGLYYYAKSLCVPIPFPGANKSILTLFKPLFEKEKPKTIDAIFVYIHAILFTGKYEDQLDKLMLAYLDRLDPRIGRMTKKWLETGYHTGILLACSLLGYGRQDNFMWEIFNQTALGSRESPSQQEDSTASKFQETTRPNATFTKSRSFFMEVYKIVVNRRGDPNTLSFLHIILVFIYRASQLPAAMIHLEEHFPWELTKDMLNYLLRSYSLELRIDTNGFPGAQKGDLPRPLPEDWAMWGLVFAQNYYPASWFKDSRAEESEKYFELSSMQVQRKERLLWLGRRLAESGRWLTWNDRAQAFGLAKAFERDDSSNIVTDSP